MVLELVQRLREHGLAVLVISHNLNDVFAVADRIAVLYLGRMVAQDKASSFDRQSVVEYMTTGGLGMTASRAQHRRRRCHAMTRADSDPAIPGVDTAGRRAGRPDGLARGGRAPRPARDRRPDPGGVPARPVAPRSRAARAGCCPVVLGLIIIVVVFQVISPHHIFLSAGNVVNLFQQSAVFMVLAMAEIFALLLGDIDLSIGYVGAVGAVIAVQLVQPATANWPWWAAIVVACSPAASSVPSRAR